MQCRAAIRGLRRLPACLLLLCLALPALPQSSRPFPGVIALSVDVSDVQRRILRVVETIPAGPGRLELYYPQWVPGNHAPRGPIEQLAGLRLRVDGRELNWQRDPLNPHRFTVILPAGTRQLQVEFQIASPQTSEQGRVLVGPDVLDLQWNQVLLYPAGYRARDIGVQATLQLPAGWKYATALTPDPQFAAAGSDRVTFMAENLEVLVDSPVFAGRLLRQYDLAPGAGTPVTMSVFAEDAGDLAVTDAQLDIHRRMVREAEAALGPPRFDRYRFLVALTEQLGGIGIEHHRSSQNTLPPAYFRSWDQRVADRDQLAHELTHSWNGKYRRPARLWTPHFNTPMQDDLLWVYEGLTQYYGYVIAARSGLWPADFAREELALVAATFDRRRPGREWRPLEDTTYMPVINARRPQPWTGWQRGEDYYQEGALLWLEVDMRIREASRGARTLDDFSRAFFSAQATEGWVSLYELQDVVRALNQVAPMDWYSFLRTRVATPRQPVLEGIERAGFRLVYNDKPNVALADVERSSNRTDLAYSLGLVLSRENVLTEVLWGGPAFRAGLTTATTVVAVNGRATTPDLLRAAVTAAAQGGPLVELIVRNGDRFRTVTIDYRDGLRYPHLEPITGREDRLARLLAPRAAP
jgi:predicted metalloprotease with PDZ domain